MSILICAINIGGCGHIGFGHEWRSLSHIDPLTEEIDSDMILCPSCDDDHAVQLTDGNFDELVMDSDKERARKMLDDENASIHGEFLNFCIKNGFVSKERLTEAQKTELGINEDIMKIINESDQLYAKAADNAEQFDEEAERLDRGSRK